MQKLYVIGLALLAFSYPFTTVLLTIGNLPIGPFNILIKGLILGLFVLSILGSLLRKKLTIPIVITPFIIFFCLFGLRLFYDVAGKGIVAPDSSAFYTLSYYAFLTMLPALAVALAYEERDLPSLEKWMFTLLLVSNVFIIIYFIHAGESIVEAIALKRLVILSENEETSALNPITIGLSGAMLAIFSIGRLSLQKQTNSLTSSINVAGVFLGMLSLALSGSRGPLVAFGVGFTFLLAAALYLRKFQQAGKKLISKKFYILIGCMLVAILYAIIFLGEDLLVFSRILDMFDTSENYKNEVRLEILEDAYSGFMDSPLLGSSYLALNGSFFVHNSIIEAFTSTGLFGGILFTGCLIYYVRCVWLLLMLKAGASALPIALVSIGQVTITLFSTSLGQAPDIWLIALLVVCISSRCNSKQLKFRP